MSPERRAELRKQVQSFWDRVAAGDLSTRDELKRYFDACPEQFVELFGGDLAGRVVEMIIDRVVGQDLAQREAILRKTEEHRKALAGAYPTTIEALLAERCSLLHLAAYEADFFQYRNMDMRSSKKAEFHERRRDRANRRYLAALKALALVKEKLTATEERRARAARDEVSRFRVGSGPDRMVSVN
jgi:hypothetical protein